MLNTSNLTLAFQALRRSRVRTYIPQVFGDVFDDFGADRLVEIFLKHIKSHSVWESITRDGHVSAEAISDAHIVTRDDCVIGVYIDLGPVDGSEEDHGQDSEGVDDGEGNDDHEKDDDRPYVGCSYSSNFHKVDHLGGIKLRGVALRVLEQHELLDYRERNDSDHYNPGVR